MFTQIITGMATSAAQNAVSRVYERSTRDNYIPDVNKNYVWTAVLVVGIIAGIYFYGKNNGTINPAPLPNDTQPKTDPATGNTINPLTASESSEITRLANSLNTQLGYWLDADATLMNDFLGSSDRVFVGTYNHYNTLYLSPPETLKSRINSYSNFKVFWSEINHQMDSIVARMDKLGLK
jgi:hypothetical protein